MKYKIIKDFRDKRGYALKIYDGPDPGTILYEDKDGLLKIKRVGSKKILFEYEIENKIKICIDMANQKIENSIDNPSINEDDEIRISELLGMSIIVEEDFRGKTHKLIEIEVEKGIKDVVWFWRYKKDTSYILVGVYGEVSPSHYRAYVIALLKEIDDK